MTAFRLYILTLFAMSAVVAITPSAFATNYYVSPTGNDGSDGLSVGSAWLSIDNGDQNGLGVLVAGDTVNVLSGVYSITNELKLTISGTGLAPIVYVGESTFDVIIDVNTSATKPGVTISGSNTYFENFTLRNGPGAAIQISADSCKIYGCYVQDFMGSGINLSSQSNLIERNIIASAKQDGIKLAGVKDFNKIYGNTIFNAGSVGINIFSTILTTRIFNNIIHTADIGISAVADNVCGFNDIWNVTTDFFEGAFDSSGGISADPLFVDIASSDFSLQSTSPCIDSALDLGYSFFGPAPDMGAIEFITGVNQPPILAAIGAKTIDENLNLNFGVSATDAESTPVLSTSSLPTGASFIDNGNGTGAFDWTPTYLQSGVYNITFYATDDSSAVDSEVVSITVNNVNREPVLATIGAKSVEEGQTLSFGVSATDPDGTTPTLSATNLPGSATFIDSGNGVGLFDFSPSFTQEGIYNVLFITFDGAMADSETVAITVTPAPVVSIDVTPDSVIVEQLAPSQFAAWGYDAGSIPVKDLTDSVTWTTTDTAGSVTASGLYTAGNQISPPEQYVKAVYQGSMSDSGLVTVISSGTLSYVQIEWLNGVVVGDTAFTTDNDSSTLHCRGYSAADSLLGDFSVFWKILGVDSIGTVSEMASASTNLNLNRIGTGQVIAAHISGIADTSGVITVSSGLLANLVISPDSATVRLNDSVLFTVIGYDADSNATATGQITWKDIGRAGRIDSTGLFVATAPGAALVSASSSLGAVADTSGVISVEELFLTTLALGDRTAAPGEERVTALTFNLHNYFEVTKSVIGITVRDQSSGLGDRPILLSNIDSIGLFLDIDHDSILTVADSLITKAAYVDTIILLDFPPVNIPPDSGRTFLVAFDISAFPRDGDTANAYLTTATDVTISDSTVVSGPAVANSFGNITFDGALASQISLAGIGNGNLTPTDTTALILSFDYPRNGYSVDTLKSLTVNNLGTATGQDIAKVYLYADDGNGLWDGAQAELFSGELIFTGDRWTLSGLSQALIDPLTRFYVGMQLDSFPTAGATVTLGIPVNGVNVSSANDGPRDEAVISPDTLTIQFNEQVLVSNLSIPGTTIASGEETSPVLAFTLQNAQSVTLRLDSLRATMYAQDPAGATQLELDSQIDSVRLYIKNGVDLTQIELSDSVIAVATVSNGVAVFNMSGLSIPSSGGSLTFCVTTFLDGGNAKNGNSLNIGFQTATDIYYPGSATLIGSFPIQNPAEFTITTFTSDAITLTPIPATTLSGGTVDAPALDFTLPDNGYSIDELATLTIQNYGSLQDNRAVKKLTLWSDKTGDGFSADDEKMGVFKEVASSQWTLRGLSSKLSGAATRFVVTVEVLDANFQGGNLRLGIPNGGAVYLSGADGPDDAQISNPNSLLLVPADRITVVSIPRASSQTLPGATDEQVLSFALYNGYIGEPKTFNALTLSNISRSPAGLSYSDVELGQLSLFYDIDGNRILQDDSLLTIATFNLGALTFSGINLTLPPESLSYFFVVADIALSVIDSDSLGVAIQQTADFDFLEAVNTNGDIPLTRGGFAVVDGSIKAQYEVFPLVSQSLTPGDTTILLYTFQPALNGNQLDTIQTLTIDNLGDASSLDISSLELWFDLNGDSLWQASDVFVGPLNPSGASWVTPPIQIEAFGVAPILFVVGDISATATTNRTIRLRLPINGCSYASGNDGPLDSSLESSGVFTINTSNLSVSLTPLSATYSLGQTITLEISTTNLTGSTLDSVLSRIVSVSDSTLTTLDSSTIVTYGLANGLSSVFRYYFTPTLPGELFWLLQTVAPTTGDSSAVVQTELVRIQSPPDTVNLEFINSIPTAVIRGQKNVFPFSVSITQPDSAGGFASVRMDSITIRLEDGAGVGSLSNNVFSRITLLAGFTNLVTLSSLPADSNITLLFDQPLLIPPGETQILTVIVDITAGSTMNEFQLTIVDANAILLIESNTAQPIAVGAGTQFPLSTAVCRIVDRADKMMLYFVNELSPEVNYGQQNVKSLNLLLRHPGSVTSSQIQVTDITVEFLDEFGSRIAPSNLVDRVSVSAAGLIIGEELATNPADTLLKVTFNSPFTLSPGQSDSLQILVSIVDVTSEDMFSLRIQDSSLITVRDLSSGIPVPAATDTAILSASSVFPIVSGLAQLKAPALPPEICVTSALTGSLAAGRDSVGLIDMTLTYSPVANNSPVRIDAIRIFMTDSLGFLIDASRLFDRIGIMFPDSLPGVVDYQLFVSQQNNYTVFPVTPKLLLYPGDTASVRLIGDIEADATIDHFMMSFDLIGSLEMSDNSDTTRQLGYLEASTCSAILPFVSPVIGIFLPAGQPRLSPLTGSVRLATQGERSVELVVGNFIYESIGPQGDIAITGAQAQILSRFGDSFVPFTGANVFERVTLLIDNDTASIDSAIVMDSVKFTLPTPYLISAGESRKISFVCDIYPDAPIGNYQMRFVDSASISLQDVNLSTGIILSNSQGVFPLATTELSVVATDLANSFSNFPNPFDPTLGQSTTIAFVLGEAATIDIELFTLTGELVYTIASQSFRSAGAHQSDRWFGLNDIGLAVVPGAYICRIIANYTSGKTEELTRKVAVIR